MQALTGGGGAQLRRRLHLQKMESKSDGGKSLPNSIALWRGQERLLRVVKNVEQ